MAIADLITVYETTEIIPEAFAEKFENADPQLTLSWALQEFGPQVAMATGFGAEGCVIIDMLSKIDPHARIFYLDTDLFFPETYELIERLKQRYGVSFERRASPLSLEAQAKQYGEKLWERQPDECCRLRKVEPLIETLA